MIGARPVTFAGGLLSEVRKSKKSDGTRDVDRNRNGRKRGEAMKKKKEKMKVRKGMCVLYKEAFKRFANQFATACPQDDKY